MRLMPALCPEPNLRAPSGTVSGATWPRLGLSMEGTPFLPITRFGGVLSNDSSRKAPPPTLASYFLADPASETGIRNLGIAWAQVAENYDAPQLFDTAWPMLRAAASQRPQDPLLYAKVGEALESASKTTEAEGLYRLSLEQDPQQVDVLRRLAGLLERSGRRSEAAEVRKQAVSILPRQSE